MAQRIRLASASSRRVEWLTEYLPGSVEIDVKPLAGEEKISEGEVSFQVTSVLEDKINRAKIQYFLEKQNALDNNSVNPPKIWIVGDTLVEDPNDGAVRCSSLGHHAPGSGLVLFSLLLMWPFLRRSRSE